jgi:hypothetical protein
MENILITLGWISILFHLVAFSTHDTKKMLKYNLTSTTLLGISMIAYGGFTGAAMSFFSVFSKTFGLIGIGKKITDIQKAIIGMIFGLTYYYFFSGENWYAILPAFSLIFIVLADLQEDIIKMKMWYYGSAFLWITYAIMIKSPSAIMYDVIGISVLTYTIIKLKKNNLENKKIL